MNVIDSILGNVAPAATTATNAALDTASARPFNVIISIDPDTKTWVSFLTFAVLVTAVFVRKA